MAFNTQEQEIIKWGLQNGKSQQDVTQAIINFRTGVVPSKPAEQPFLGGLKQDLNTRTDRMGAILDRPSQDVQMGAVTIPGGLVKGVQAFGQGAGLAANAIEKTAEQIPGVKQVFGAIGGGIQWLATSDFSPAKMLGDQIGKSQALQEVTQLYGTDQNFKDSVDAVANIARLGGDVQMAVDAVGLSKKVFNKVKSTITPPGGGGALSITSENALKAATKLRNNIQLSIAKNNVSPQLGSSSKRLFAEGTKRLEDPVLTYDKFLEQSKLGVTDIYGDTALGQVGGKMGDAFETVIKDRQAVGATIGAELKINGKIKINIADTKTKLFAEVSEGRPKFAPDEVSMVDDFIDGLNALGDNPSVSDIDNFIGRTKAELPFLKAKSGVMGTTNAERIINGQITRLKGSLDPAVNGNKALGKYWTANNAFSDLSDFVKDGITFLGKKTQSGDFAKDASVAKSAVQSILNSGKKDWMIKLRALTGYNALDESVLALQAMKDAGDFRGLSLNQTQSELIGLISEGGLPTSKAGFTQKLIDFAMEKGGKVLAGTPEEQTRAFLQSLKNESTQTIKKPTKTTPANTGASTKKINQSKTSDIVISPKTTQPPNFSKGEIPTSKKSRFQSAKDNLKNPKNAQGGFIKNPLAKLPEGKEPSKPITESVSSPNSSISAKEAIAKGLTEEQYVKGQGTPLYHGSDMSSVIEKEGFKKMPIKTGVSAFGEGSYFSTSKSDAKGYGGVVQAYVPKDIKLKTVSSSDAYKVDTKQLIKEGYGGTEMTSGSGKNIVIFDQSRIKTTSQLRAEYQAAKKANK